MKVYEEIVAFIASGPASNHLAGFKPSEETKNHVAYLIQKEKEANLSPDEHSELNHYMQIEHIMRLVKAKAHQRITNG